MFVLLILFTLADVALGVLLIAVSGYMLQGVNNTAPAPGATLYVLFILICFAAPALAWALQGRIGPGWALAIAALPVAGGLVALNVKPPY
jgi:hypothetical protein